MSGAVVLFSGGQDSSTCLAWAAREFGTRELHPVSFDYGQRHAVELECGRLVAHSFGAREPHVIPMDGLSPIAGTALTSSSVDLETTASGSSDNVFAREHGLPSSFVPARNLLFLTLACAYGAQRGIYDLVTGVCEADAAGYPDCRERFVRAANVALIEALDEPRIRIHTPLLHRSKAETFALADELDVLGVIVRATHTCYDGDRSHRHEWGYGCGECLACRERARGWERFAQRRLVDV
jgi:7-cyano-7-deazaguanine synthase